MTSAVFEIVELANGEFVLRRSDTHSDSGSKTFNTSKRATDKVKASEKLNEKDKTTDRAVESNTESKNIAPLVTIRFSEEALNFLDGNSADIAKVMIEAGLLEVEDLVNQYILGNDASLEMNNKPPVLH